MCASTILQEKVRMEISWTLPVNDCPVLVGWWILISTFAALALRFSWHGTKQYSAIVTQRDVVVGSDIFNCSHAINA